MIKLLRNCFKSAFIITKSATLLYPVKENNMLPTIDDICCINKYLMIDDKEKQTRKLKINIEDIPKEDIEKLLSYDDAFVFMKGYHLISDHQKLFNNKTIG